MECIGFYSSVYEQCTMYNDNKEFTNTIYTNRFMFTLDVII